MRKAFLVFILLFILGNIHAQLKCVTTEYMVQEMKKNSAIESRLNEIEKFTAQAATFPGLNERINVTSSIIRIPVVFHVLYNTAVENISTERLIYQLNALNRDFRRKNADTLKTPAAFLPFAADMEIEFYLANSDPLGRNTTGIERKYTPVKFWLSDDKMKFKESGGADAWDTKSYLNIWVCKMLDVMGYSTLPGTETTKDGVVLSYTSVSTNDKIQNTVGRTLVHEIGHWLNLRHIWGDSFCGDDFVNDTPKQSTYTLGCHTGIRRSCGNTEAGDMYMNYMDFTDDGCVNLFTKDQKQRARSLFQAGGYRYSMLATKAFDEPVIYTSTLPDINPNWKEAKLYPNPAFSSVTINLEHDYRWVGKEIHVLNLTGNVVLRKIITSTSQQIDINTLPAGIYFIRAQKDSEKIMSKFIKL